MFYHRTMQTVNGPIREPEPTPTPPHEALADALARLRGRWGSAAISLGNGAQHDRDALLTHGALALAPFAAPDPTPTPVPIPHPADVTSTGFPDLDALLGPGGLPRQASAAIRGDTSSGKTTLALRCLAEAQQGGAIAAWLDLQASFDPIEAFARGVDPRWLLVVRSKDHEEGFTICGSLLSSRVVDLLVVDLPAGLPPRREAILRRLSAHARRVGARLIVLEPQSISSSTHGALAEVTGLRLELEREGWIRLGRDVVGQRTRVTVAKNRFGPPGRHVVLGIHYLDDGERRMGTHRFAGP